MNQKYNERDVELHALCMEGAWRLQLTDSPTDHTFSPCYSIAEN
jgi:hypothetical protein